MNTSGMCTVRKHIFERRYFFLTHLGEVVICTCVPGGYRSGTILCDSAGQLCHRSGGGYGGSVHHKVL